MSFKTLVYWIHVSDLEAAQPSQVRPLVRAALDDLSEDDPRREPLEELESVLWEGVVPVEALQELAQEWGDYVPPDGLQEEEVSDGVRLEDEYRRIAGELSQREWHTTFFQQALKAVGQGKRGDHHRFYATLDEMRSRLEGAWGPYAESPVGPEEVTAETVVGHRMLQDGVSGWFEALDMIEQAAETQEGYDEALELAEQANRLLVAVQLLAERVKRQAALG